MVFASSSGAVSLDNSGALSSVDHSSSEVGDVGEAGGIVGVVEFSPLDFEDQFSFLNW